MRAIRLLFMYCFVCHIFSHYRAYETYQNFERWVDLNRKDKVVLAWGFVSTVVMAIFTAAYAVLEYRTRQKRRKDRV
jgi:hypothetical protein